MYIYFRGVIMSVLESCRCSCSRVGSIVVDRRRLRHSCSRVGSNIVVDRRRLRHSCSRVGSNIVVDRRLSFKRIGNNTPDRRRRKKRSIEKKHIERVLLERRGEIGATRRLGDLVLIG